MRNGSRLLLLFIYSCIAYQAATRGREQSLYITETEDCHVLLVGVASSFIVWWYLSRIVEVSGRNMRNGSRTRGREQLCT